MAKLRHARLSPTGVRSRSDRHFPGEPPDICRLVLFVRGNCMFLWSLIWQARAVELSVVEGDITAQEVDAVVNAANRAMRGGGGVDGAIHAAGGPAVLADCVERFPSGLETGQAGSTTAGQMAARWVIHVVGPNYSAGERDRSLLTSCYSNALSVADSLGASSIAFPLVSAGIYGWPRADAIAAAVDTLRAATTSVRSARLVAFGRSAYDEIAAVLNTR